MPGSRDLVFSCCADNRQQSKLITYPLCMHAHRITTDSTDSTSLPTKLLGFFVANFHNVMSTHVYVLCIMSVHIPDL